MSDSCIIKLALGIEYDGSSYFGWQRQKGFPSIQEHLERAISIIANEPVTIYCAGRTDTFVHATGQVIHFETHARRTETAWTLGINSHLPFDIAVRWVISVRNNFHARFSATARRYRYIIYNHRLRPAILRHGLNHYYHQLDTQAMTKASQCLLGENNFTFCRALNCQSRSPWRNIHHLFITRQGKYVVIDIKANAFLYHMVRNIVSSLLEVGCGKRPESWISEILEKRQRIKFSPIAQAQGLYLVSVEYPSCFAIPEELSVGPLFLSN